MQCLFEISQLCYMAKLFSVSKLILSVDKDITENKYLITVAKNISLCSLTSVIVHLQCSFYVLHDKLAL